MSVQCPYCFFPYLSILCNVTPLCHFLLVFPGRYSFHGGTLDYIWLSLLQNLSVTREIFDSLNPCTDFRIPLSTKYVGWKKNVCPKFPEYVNIDRTNTRCNHNIWKVHFRFVMNTSFSIAVLCILCHIFYDSECT